ncbi:hypothetical protein [Gemmatimonas aurantiaca]|uniref:hypothetical protein n=1 Tax=Gemmatimonas aurantiaca TaxID=173480 RepID=UPI00301C2FAA
MISTNRFPSDMPGDDLPGDTTPSAWMVDTLRMLPGDGDTVQLLEARARIMTRVRALPTPRRLVAPMPLARWRRRGTLSGMGGVVLTAVLALMLTVHEGEHLTLASRVHATALVLGDSAVPISTADAGHPRGEAGTPGARQGRSRWLDTMRVVELVVRGSGLREVALRQTAAVRAVALARISATEWRARALVPRDAVDVTVIVNDVALAPTPVASPPR